MALSIVCYSKMIAFVKYSAVKIERTDEIIIRLCFYLVDRLCYELKLVFIGINGK